MKVRFVISIVAALVLVAVAVLPALATEYTDWVQAQVTVNEQLSVTVSGSINFGSVNPDGSTYGAQGQSDGTPAVTVTVATNAASANISIKGTTSGAIALSNWKYSTTYSGNQTGLTTNFVDVYTNIDDGTYDFYHWITVPVGTQEGTYTANITYKVTTS